MTESSIQPGEPSPGEFRLDRLQGTVGTPMVKAVHAEDVHRFLLAVSPGKRSTPGIVPLVREGDTAPTTFFCPDPIVAAEAMGLPRPRPYNRNIDGGSEWEIHAAVQVGDVLTLVPRIAEVRQRVTSDGRNMLTTVVEIQAWNQDGALAGIARGDCLSYEERP